ncbi:MAG: SRPBCC domain-containing protein [Nitrospinae bacterium]|nr:SRPBCC domain-containing protein [Nitrospinota bacterium]
MDATASLKTAGVSLSNDKELVLKRVFNAPKEIVFKAWTDADRLIRWWAPKGFTTTSLKVDLRTGGAFLYCMRSAEGQDFWGRGVYREIIEPKLIVYTDSFSDEKGALVEPSHYGMNPAFPSETLVTVRIIERKGKTEVTLRHAVPVSIPERSGMEQGWGEMLDQLAEELEKEKTVRKTVTASKHVGRGKRKALSGKRGR